MPPPKTTFARPGMTPEEVDDLYSSVRDADRRIAARSPDKPAHAEVAEVGLQGAKIAVGAGLYGFIAGLTGSSGIGPVPLGLAGAGAAGAAIMAGYVPKDWRKHVIDVAVYGGVASAATIWALGRGAIMRQDMQQEAPAPKEQPRKVAETPAPQKMAGAPPTAIGGGGVAGAHALGGKPPLSVHLTEAELRAIEQRRKGLR